MAFTSSKMAGLIPRHRIDIINHHFELHKDLTDVSIDARERAAQQGVELIETLRLALEQAPDTVDRGPWEELAKKAIDQFHKKKAIIGIVGGTGAGKTSFINALLEEETLLPTNCMRACTATITEISFNEGPSKYRAVIEFLSRSDWQDELMRGFEVLFDHNGRIVKDATNEDSEAGIFYSKIRAIYSDLTRDGLEKSTVDSLLSHADVRVLDRTEDFQEDSAARFADRLQRIVDSKDRSTRGSNKDVAYWPIIKRVRLFVRAKVLATGVTLVDLPGIQDSTPARAKVAEDYMKSCSGLIVTAPIHRAKDDRVAKNLLGPTFRRQLMMDGGYSTMTFACTKIDEINIREMVNTVDAIKREVNHLTNSINNKRQERESVEGQLQGVTPKLAEAEKKLFETSAKCDIYEDLARESRHMFTPTSSTSGNGKRKLTEVEGDDDGSQTQRKRHEKEDENNDKTLETEAFSDDPNMREVQDQYQHIDQQSIRIQADRDEAKKLKNNLTADVNRLRTRLAEIDLAITRMEDQKRSSCIKYRNEYVIKAIKEDFVAGVKECDEERAALDEEWDPTKETRDYEKLASELAVLTVSSRAYQKKAGRMRDEAEIPGFATMEDTGMPAALRHCEQLTQAGRRKNADFFLAMMSKLLNSLNLWVANQINSCKVSDLHREQARYILQDHLATLKNSFTKLIRHAVDDVARRLREMIYKSMTAAQKKAAREAVPTCIGWSKHSHGTWKAICRRDGCFHNENTGCDWNEELAAPLISSIAPHWANAFSEDLDNIFASFAIKSRKKIKDFHASVPALLTPFGINTRKSYQRLQGQHTGYKQALAEAEDSACDFINRQQREISRGFKPHIAEAMKVAYLHCTNITGAGSYVKMRKHMNVHIEQHPEMFRDATKAVQKQLDRMLFGVKDSLTAEIDRVHADIAKDYMETLCGDGKEEDTKTDVTDIFVKQVAHYLETCRQQFQKPAEEHARRMEKFGSIFEASAPFSAALSRSSAPIQIDDEDEDGDAYDEGDPADPLSRNAFTPGPRQAQKEKAGTLRTYAEKQRQKYSGASRAGAEVPIKQEPLDDDDDVFRAPEDAVVPSVEGGFGEDRGAQNVRPPRMPALAGPFDVSDDEDSDSEDAAEMLRSGNGKGKQKAVGGFAGGSFGSIGFGGSGNGDGSGGGGKSLFFD